MTKDQRASRRKKHRNSKLGCATCKRRRVKCSESLPECTNCVKHGSRCEYLDYSEAQLHEFRKAQLDSQSRQSVTDLPAHSLEKLSLDSGVRSSGDDGKQIQRQGSEDYFSQAPISPQVPLSDQSLSYPGIPMSASSSHAADSGFRSRISSTETALFGDGISPTAERPGFVPHLPSANSISGFHSSGVTQNFDNLLTEQDHQIIYPVYSFRNSVESQWSYGSSSFSAETQKTSISSDPMANYFSETHHVQDEASKILPNAIHNRKSFKVLHPHDMDFDARLYSYVINLGPAIAAGKADLQQIRDLYHVWLGHFIYKAFRSSIMFSCLTNLTTNYLITNVFRARHMQSQEVTKHWHKTLLIHSIKHYAAVIKSLRSLLNKNSDPQLASSVSYILSIMSIYDPEATVNSTVCFRDGMFSVLSYSLSISKNKGVAPPLFIPIHMKLAANIVRTVYLPAYNPVFLNEYEMMLRRLGTVISSIQPSEIVNNSTFEFIVEVYDDLLKFCQESIQVHIPKVNQNLDNLPLQLDILFTMFRKWANLGPGRLLTVSRSTDPLEKVLNLFFRLFRKAVYAVVPQVKFFYLRDFDSPLMLDVIPSLCDASVIASLDNPGKNCLASEAYARVLPELKLLSAYAIRVNTFLNMRIAILYKNLVYNEKVRELYPINNVVDWKESISDIHATRKEFQERIGLQEKCIENFNNTYIVQVHYPRVHEPGVPDRTGQKTEEVDVDLLSMQQHGLLKNDELPAMYSK